MVLYILFFFSLGMKLFPSEEFWCKSCHVLGKTQGIPSFSGRRIWMGFSFCRFIMTRDYEYLSEVVGMIHDTCSAVCINHGTRAGQVACIYAMVLTWAV